MQSNMFLANLLKSVIGGIVIGLGTKFIFRDLDLLIITGACVALGIIGTVVIGIGTFLLEIMWPKVETVVREELPGVVRILIRTILLGGSIETFQWLLYRLDLTQFNLPNYLGFAIAMGTACIEPFFRQSTNRNSM